MPEVDEVGDGGDAAATPSEPLSIGEVLSVLAEEFPDITISKIRFLESQGLVRPERNASGYRQFGDADIERLRWILRQQRDHFLPLKVIKSTLDRGVDLVDAGLDQPTLWTAVADEAAADEAAAHKIAQAEREAAGGDGGEVAAGAAGRSRHPSNSGGAAERGPRRHSTAADVVAALQEDPRASGGPSVDDSASDQESGDATVAAAETGPAAHTQTGGPDAVGAVPAEAVELGRADLLAASGLSEEYLEGLEEFGLLQPRDEGGESLYDGADLSVARAASRCSDLGVGPRHLRIYRVAAVREAGLVEQVVMPLLKKRNPTGRAQAVESAVELSDLGAQLHAVLLARELGPRLSP